MSPDALTRTLPPASTSAFAPIQAQVVGLRTTTETAPPTATPAEPARPAATEMSACFDDAATATDPRNVDVGAVTDRGLGGDGDDPHVSTGGDGTRCPRSRGRWRCRAGEVAHGRTRRPASALPDAPLLTTASEASGRRVTRVTMLTAPPMFTAAVPAPPPLDRPQWSSRRVLAAETTTPRDGASRR